MAALANTINPSRRAMLAGLSALTAVAAETYSDLAFAGGSEIERSSYEFMALDHAYDSACADVDDTLLKYVEPERPKHGFMEPGRYENVRDENGWRSLIDISDRNRQELLAFINGPVVRTGYELSSEIDEIEIENHASRVRCAQKTLQKIEDWHRENDLRRDALNLPALEAVEKAAEQVRQEKYDEVMALEAVTPRDLAFQVLVLQCGHSLDHAYKLLDRLVDVAGLRDLANAMEARS